MDTKHETNAKPKRKRKPDGEGRDPTPQQIRQRCLEIQAGWSFVEERRRRLSHVEGDVPEPMALQPTKVYVAGKKLI
jgi:hypothetical protein